jgi:hypothetical protein
MGVFAAAVGLVVLGVAGGASAALPDGRGYELVSPVAKNGVSPYAAVPARSGEAVDFQAAGAFAGATSGSLNLYQSARTSSGWQTTPLTPTPATPLGPLEEQAPVFFSPDLTQTIFTTPQSYAPGDADSGGLDLYLRSSNGALGWLSQGSQGGTVPDQVTFDGATPDAGHVLFSSGESLTADATGVEPSPLFPEAEFLYDRMPAGGQTHLVNVNENGEPTGGAGNAKATIAANPGAASTLTSEYVAAEEEAGIYIASTAGFVKGHMVTIEPGGPAEETLLLDGTGGEGRLGLRHPLAHDHAAGVEVVQAAGGPVAGDTHLTLASGADFASGYPITIEPGGPEQETQIVDGVVGTTLGVTGEDGLVHAHPAGVAVVQDSYGAILGNGTSLTTGAPPVSEYLPADARGGTTTHAISSDGSKVFFESPPPVSGKPVGLYMRENDSRTVEIAGSAQFEGASADGSLVFYTAATKSFFGIDQSRQLHAFNTTGHRIGQVPAMSAIPLSSGLNGDEPPTTTLISEAARGDTSIAVASTAGFVAGETIYLTAFGSTANGSGVVPAVIASVSDAHHLALTEALYHVYNDAGAVPFPVGDAIAGSFRQASVTAVSNDGSHVYFISNGVLAANTNAAGHTAVGNGPNLYVYDTGSGETTFIATVAEKDVVAEGFGAGPLVREPDVSRAAVPSADGAVLVFASAGNLTGQNPAEEFTEVYRYAVGDGSLVCVSCTATGVEPTGDAGFGETAGGTYDPSSLSSPMSEDGSRIFFQTPDSLVGEDTNGGAPPSAKFGTPSSTDVYEWEAGKVHLISSGTSSNPAVLDGTTPSGDDVFFTTDADLVPANSDGGYENVFDARVGGGFPAPAAGAPSCVGQSCRAAFGAPPVFGASGSALLDGSGNLPAPPAVKASGKAKPKAKAGKCRKGLVRKRGNCVKKKTKGKKSAAKKSAAKRAANGLARSNQGGRS